MGVVELWSKCYGHISSRVTCTSSLALSTSTVDFERFRKLGAASSTILCQSGLNKGSLSGDLVINGLREMTTSEDAAPEELKGEELITLLFNRKFKFNVCRVESDIFTCKNGLI